LWLPASISAYKNLHIHSWYYLLKSMAAKKQIYPIFQFTVL